MNKKNIYLWTGEGCGKSTSAFGVALRAAGHKKKVVIIQFMKGRKNIGEYKAFKKLKPYCEMHQFGKKEFIKPLNKPSKEDKKLAEKGLEFIDKVLENKKPFLLILDEINLSCAIGLLDTDEVVDEVKKASDKTIVYLTGRRAPKKLKDISGYVNEIKLLKAPKKFPVRKGIEW